MYKFYSEERAKNLREIEGLFVDQRKRHFNASEVYRSQKLF